MQTKLVILALDYHYLPWKAEPSYWTTTLGAVSESLLVQTLEWHKLRKGMITGCTISVILLALTMNMLAKSVEVEYRGPKCSHW